MEGNNRLPRHYTELKGKKGNLVFFREYFLSLLKKASLHLKKGKP